MTNPNDYWRHQSPAAPHAPAHDRLTPGLPLQPNQPAPFDTSFDAYQPSAGPVDPIQLSVGLLLVVVFVVLIFSGPIFGTLYPLAAGAALVAGLVTNGLLHIAAPGLDDSSRLPFALLAALVVFWSMSRFDHRLAANVPPYRLARHVVRVVLIAGFISLTTLNDSGGQWMPRSIGQLRLLADSRHLAVMAVAAVLAHLFLTRSTGIRGRWDRGLEFFRLRPR